MWNNIKEIYGGDNNVKRAKAEILRGQFDQMKMKILPIMLKESRQV